MCSNISYLNINQDSVLRENIIITVISCLSKYQLEAESSFIREPPPPPPRILITLERPVQNTWTLIRYQNDDMTLLIIELYFEILHQL